MIRTTRAKTELSALRSGDLSSFNWPDMDRPLVLSTNRPFIIHKDILVWLVIIQDVDVGSKE